MAALNIPVDFSNISIDDTHPTTRLQSEDGASLRHDTFLMNLSIDRDGKPDPCYRWACCLTLPCNGTFTGLQESCLTQVRRELVNLASTEFNWPRLRGAKELSFVGLSVNVDIGSVDRFSGIFLKPWNFENVFQIVRKRGYRDTMSLLVNLKSVEK